MAEIHPQLRQDCILLGRFPLSHLLLMNDASYPWCILVPDREAISEIYQLSEADRQALMRESCCLARVLAEQFQAHKINIAALGNMVPQLHIHHVARYRDDAAWPAPVWGRAPAVPYAAAPLQQAIARLRAGLGAEVAFGV